MPFPNVFAITERRDMGLYEVPLSMSLFGMGTMLANFHMCDIMFLLKAVLNILVRNASPRGHMRGMQYQMVLTITFWPELN